jgi:hypothetical protein
VPEEAFAIDVREYEGIPVLQIASEELYKTAIRTKNTWRENIRNGRGAAGNHGSPYVNTGEAATDVTIEPKAEGALEYTIGGDVVQLAVAEYGRAPGSMPPPEPISRWMREALGETDPDPWPIQKHIEENGLEPFKPGLAAYHEHAPELSENSARRIDAALTAQEE